MSKLDKVLDDYIRHKIGNRVPTIEDVAQAYRDGMYSVKRKSWNVHGVPKGKKPIVGLFFEGRKPFVKMINPEDVGNLFAGGMIAWAEVTSLITTKSLLTDAEKARTSELS